MTTSELINMLSQIESEQGEIEVFLAATITRAPVMDVDFEYDDDSERLVAVVSA